MNIPINNIFVAEQDRNPAEYAVLGAFERGPAHGYDLYQYLSENLGAIWTLGLSQVYALLSRLEQEGLITHQRQAQEKRPDRKNLDLTAMGVKIFKDWVRRPVPHVRDLRLEFLCKLSLRPDTGPGRGNTAYQGPDVRIGGKMTKGCILRQSRWKLLWKSRPCGFAYPRLKRPWSG